MKERFLNDQVCLVTGGAQGIGWAICCAMVERGAHVYACDISPENLERAASELEQRGWKKKVHLSLCDVADRSALESWINDTWQSTGRIDVLVNNAAFIRWDDVTDLSVEDMQRTMSVGYDAMVIGIKTVLPKMVNGGRGHIVNMGSVAGRMFLFGGYAAYAASKAAIAAYTNVLQNELRTSPVNVTLVQPGIVVGTDLFRRQVDPARMPRIADFLPVASPERIARAVVTAIRKRTPVVTIPWSYKVLLALYTLFPWLSRWLSRWGKSGRFTRREERQDAT